MAYVDDFKVAGTSHNICKAWTAITDTKHKKPDGSPCFLELEPPTKLGKPHKPDTGARVCGILHLAQQDATGHDKAPVLRNYLTQT